MASNGNSGTLGQSGLIKNPKRGGNAQIKKMGNTPGTKYGQNPGTKGSNK